MSEEELFQQFVSQIEVFLRGTNEEKVEAEKWIRMFQEEHREATIFFSISCLSQVDPNESRYINLFLTLIKNAFTPSQYLSPEEIVEKYQKWDNKDAIQETIYKFKDSPDISVRQTAAKCLYLICEYDKVCFEQLQNHLLEEIRNKEQEPSDFALNFFRELLESDFLSRHNIDSKNELVVELITQLFRIFTWDEIAVDSRIIAICALKPIIMNLDCDDLKQIVQHVSQIIISLYEPANTNESARRLLAESFDFLKVIFKSGYNHILTLFPNIVDAVLGNLHCEIPLENHPINSHDSKIYNLLFLKVITNFENKVQQHDQDENSVLSPYIENITNDLLHLLLPSNPKDFAIEDPANAEPCFYASIILSNLCANQSYFPKLLPILQHHIDNNIGNPSFPIRNTVLHCIIAIASGIFISEFEARIYSLINTELIPNYLDPTNLRLIDTTIYTIRKIVDKYPISKPQDFDNIIEHVIIPSINSDSTIRDRCGDVLFLLFSQAPSDALFERFDRLPTICEKLAFGEENDIIISPIDALYKLIMRLPENNDVLEAIKQIFEKYIENMVPDRPVQVLICSMIVINAVASKLGRIMSASTEDVFWRIANVLIEVKDMDLWKNGLIALLKVLDTGVVDMNGINRVIELSELASQSEEPILIYGSIRLIGKFVAHSNGMPTHEFPNLVTFIDRMLSQDASPQIFNGAMLAMHEMNNKFENPTPEMIEYVTQLLEKALGYQITEETQLGAAAFIASFASLLSCESEIMSSYISKMFRRLIFYIEALVKGKLMNDSVFKSTCSLLNIIGSASRTACPGAKLALNRVTILSMFEEKQKSKDPYIANLASKTMAFVKGL